jgi:hypothetical protein
MDGEDDCRRRQTTSKGLNTRVPFDVRDLDLGYSASARRVMRHRHHRCSVVAHRQVDDEGNRCDGTRRRERPG